MPGGIFKVLFEDNGEDQGRGSSAQQQGPSSEADGYEGEGGSSNSYDTDTNAEAHFNPTVQAHQEIGATWENPDGSEAGWSHSLDATATVDLNAAATAGTHYEQGDYDA